MRESVTVKAVLRTDKSVNKEGKRPVHLLFYNGTKQIRISTRLFVEEKHWDKKTGSVIINRHSNDDLRFVSERIIQLKGDYNSNARKMLLANKPITEDSIKSHFKGTGHESFYAYYERIIKARKPTLRKDTYRIYMTTLWILKAFRKTLSFEEINNDFVRDFDNYLRVKRKNKDGGVTNKHKNLRYVIGQAIEDGLMEKNPYKKFKSTQPSDRVIYLEKEEIKKLEELDRSEFKTGLMLTLDMFLFSCYTGLRFSDVIPLKINEVDFKKRLLTKIQVKTNREVQVPLHDKAISILKRNIEEGRITCFSRIANSNANSNLKTLMPLATITKRLTFHISRHTFGTYLGQNGIRIEDISRMMGHASLKETMKYVKPAKEMMRRAIDNFDF